MRSMQAETRIRAPIPGQSLTDEPRGYAWERPPELTTPEQALQFYLPRITNKEAIEDIMLALENGFPLSTLVKGIYMNGVMEGKHSIDVGMLVIPILVELMSNMAEANQVPFKSGMEREETGEISPATIALARKQGKLKPMKGAEEPAPQPQPEQPPEQPPMGLMTRREQ